MTSPVRIGSLGDAQRLQDSEWNDYQAVHKRLMEELFNMSQDFAGQLGLHPPNAIQGAFQQPGIMQQSMPEIGHEGEVPGTGMTQQQYDRIKADLIDRAGLWNIPHPEQYSPQQLQQILDQRLLGLKRAPETTPETVTEALMGSITEAASASMKVLGHFVGQSGQALEQIPFVGKMLTDMLNTERSRTWLYHWSNVADEASKIIVATQPQKDLGAAQFLTGAGQMAGYLLPAVAAWEGIGALGASLPAMPWLGKLGTSAIARASVRGALSSLVLQDPDASPGEQALNVGLGAILGGAAMWGGAGSVARRIGLGATFGTLGYGFGSTQGSTPEERQANAKYWGLGGAALGILAPTAGKMFAKARSGFKSPMDAALGDNPPPDAPPGESVVVPEPQPTLPGSAYGPPQISANPATGPLGLPQGQYNMPGVVRQLPPGQYNMPAITELPPTQLGPNGEVQVVSPQQAQIGAPQVAGLLPAQTYPTHPRYANLGPTPEEVVNLGIATGDHYQLANVLYQYPTEPTGVEDLHFAYDISRHVVENPSGYQFPEGIVNRAQELLRTLPPRIDAKTFNLQRNPDMQFKALPSVTRGPAYLIGSKVVDANGNPLRVYHGTKAEYDVPDLSFDSGGNLYAKGVYHTEDPEIAGTPGYVGQMRTIWEGLDQVYAQIKAAHPDIQGIDDTLLQHELGVLGQNDIVDQQTVEWFKNVYGYDLTPHGRMTTKPNIRPAFLDIRNPWDMDKIFDNEEINGILDRLDAAYPEYDWTAARMAISQPNNPTYSRRIGFKNTGDNLWHILSNVETFSREQGPVENINAGWTYPEAAYPMGNRKIGEDGLNAALRTIGYDGITHIGGINGGKQHRVWIVWDPGQIHSPFSGEPLTTRQAMESARAMTKQATIAESATAPIAAAKVQMTDADVVTAAKSSNPAGPTIIQGVGRPLDVLAEHPDVHFVQRGDRLDAVVGPVTDLQLFQYEHFGAFEGQHVSTARGVEGTIYNVLGDDKAGILTEAGDRVQVPWEEVMPSRYGAPQVDAPDLYNSFKADLLRYLNEESAQAGMSPVLDIWDPRAQDTMQTHLIDYLKRRGIEDPGTIQAIDEDVNQRFIAEARDLDPEARDFQEQQQAVWAESETARSEMPLPVSTEEKAQSKGFIWLTDPARGGTLKDTLNPEGGLEIPMESEAAAEEFLRSVDRVAPDLNPATPAPAEAGTIAAADGVLEPRLPLEEHADLLGDTMHEWVGGGAGAAGGAPPSEPPPTGRGFGGAMDPDEWAKLSGEAETLPEQFARLRRDDPQKLDALRKQFTGNVFRYTRYLMQKAEDALHNAGVDLGRAWLHYENLETARTHSDNDSLPWIQEFGDIMAGFRHKIMRSGDVMRIHMIEDPIRRIDEWTKLGEKYHYSKAQVQGFVEADNKLRDFWYRFHTWRTGSELYGARANQEFMNFMATVRGRHAAGKTTGVYSSDGILSDEGKFFAGMAENGDWQFRDANVKDMGQHIIRGAMFDKYQLGPWQQLMDAWNDPRVPEEFRNLMVGHARLMRYGYDPRGDVLVNGVADMISKVVPIGRREASMILQVPINAMYRSMLGGKASIFFRDAIQPLLALGKIRAQTLGSVYADVLHGTGENSYAAMRQRGLDGGWITPEAPAMEGIGAFEDQGFTGGELQNMTPAQRARREAVAERLDIVEDIPAWLKGLERRTNTLNAYGKLQGTNRLIVGEAAYRQATAGLNEYRRLELEALLSRDPSRAMSMQELMDQTYMSSFSKPIQRRLGELIDAGNDKGAAELFARQVADWSQFKYGRREQPAIVRSQFGRLMYTFGNFTGQFAEAVGSMLTSGSANPRARAAQIARGAMVLGGVTWGLKALENKTGWGFSKWAWGNSLKYAGSPIAQGLADTYQVITGAIAASENRALSGAQQGALSDFQTGHPFLQLGADMFPYTGYFRTAAELARAQQGPYPLEQSARFLVTGDRGTGTLTFPPTFLDQQRDELLQRIRQADSVRHSGHPGSGGIQ